MGFDRNTDYIQQLVNYIKRNLSKGYTTESLKWALVNQGHSRDSVDKAVSQANEQLALQAPKLVEKPVIRVNVEPKIEPKLGFFSRLKSWFS